MPLSSGERLGPYEILAPLGAGGMGEVYRARDPRLGRDVAIKVLQPALAQNPDRLARFEREAKALAALNHPNIAAIYGLEGRAIVMELVEGPTLADRIAAEAIPLEESLKIAAQIADALEAAHEKGIVHRDLKPANVKAPPDGPVKVLDLGLATALPGVDRETGDAVNSPTLTMGATEAGVILGTAAYMSPEQASGKRVDRRADIWSFGVVLWEMLTGQRLFDTGESVSHTLADVLRAPIDFTRLPAAVPAVVRELLQRCLDRDVKTRLRDIGEARITIQRYLLNPRVAVSTETPVGRTRSGPAWALAGVATAAALVLGFIHFRQPPPQRQVLRYTLAGPEETPIQQFAVSPDGHYLLMRTAEGLSVRALDSLEAQPLAGTAGANYPFWSADSRYIGFFADDKLKKISVTGGPAQALCDAPNGRGGTWNRDGVILFTPASVGLSRVSATGGVPVPVTKPESGSHRHPFFLPDGRHFLYVALFGKNNGIYLASLDSAMDPKQNRRLVPDESQPAYYDGHLLFVRDQTLMAQPMDPKTLNASGELFPVAEQVSFGANTGERLYSISATGVLIYRAGGNANRQHRWFDRAGKELSTIGSPIRSGNALSLAPDGRRLATQRLADAGGATDLWVFDLEHGTDGRFTFDASQNVDPIWSPDGGKIAFASNRIGGIYNLYQRAANGTGRDELLLETKENKTPTDWSRDGRFLIFRNQGRGVDNLWALPLSGDRKPVPLIQSELNSSQGQLSPDGRWIAYTSVESGRPEVYVQPFALKSPKTAAGKWQVSTAGGLQPRWRSDGKELFYMAPDRKLMAVEVKAGASFQRGTPKALFASLSEIPGSLINWGYAPSADGQRFLIVTGAGERGATPPLTVVVNWLAGVTK